MHKVLKAFPCSFDGISSEQLRPGDVRDFGSMTDGLLRVGLIGEDDGKGSGGVLRQDGPTIAEYVAAGYPASGYPPQGYASRSTAEEIEAAVKAEEAAKAGAQSLGNDLSDAKAEEAMRAELTKMTNAELIELAGAEGTAVETDNNKATLVEKIIAGRKAKADAAAAA